MMTKKAFLPRFCLKSPGANEFVEANHRTTLRRNSLHFPSVHAGGERQPGGMPMRG